MSWEIIQADARDMPLEDDSVDLIVCSPPYWGLRSYRDAGEHYDGQIGSEDSPQRFVDELVGMIDSEWRRVLKPVGSLWLNLGDKYAGAGGHNNDGISAKSTLAGNGHRGGVAKDGTPNKVKATRRTGPHSYPKGTESARPKSLLGLPWRVALALIDRGWILRAEVIWSKPNGLPESVTDRVRRSHEQWFHLTLEPSYFSAVDEIREEFRSAGTHGFTGHGKDYGDDRNDNDRHMAGERSPLGRLPGSVWTIPTEPLIIPDTHREHFGLPDHFAAFPTEWPRRIIQGWSPSGVCVECGEGRRIQTGRPCEACGAFIPTQGKECPECGHRRDWRTEREASEDHNATEWDKPGLSVPRRAPQPNQTILGGETCDCPEPDAPTRPVVILDPMCGTGTVPGVAHMLGRHGIGIDLSGDYCNLARWRIQHSGHFDKVLARTTNDKQQTLSL